MLPGDLIGKPGQESTPGQVGQMLENLKANAARPAVQTSSHRDPPVHMPVDLDRVTHVRVKRAKPGPLGHSYEGPFEIYERVSNSCVRIRVGSFANGEPKYELHHWNNLKPAVLRNDTKLAERTRPGRAPAGLNQA